MPGVRRGGWVVWLSLALTLALLLWYYAFEPRYGAGRVQSAFDWLWSAWNSENDYEHGPLFPLVIAGLIVHRLRGLREVADGGSLWGLAAVVVGAVFYAAAYRTLQPRVAVGALPFLLWGCAWCLWGWRVARLLAFPLFFFLLAIPLPSFRQATTGLQLVATAMAHHGASWFGVETLVEGTRISSAKGNWEPLEIAAGCSGIRSLMALLMISGAWAYVARMVLWKRALLFVAAFPLAILGNSLRVISIFIIAEYGDARWASTTWHDWSGLLLFYPFSLVLLLVLHSVLEGGLPWRQAKRIEMRRRVRSGGSAAEEVRTNPEES